MNFKTYELSQLSEGTPVPFALDLSLQGIRLVYHLKGSLTVLGDVAFTAPDRDTRMAALATTARRLSEPPISVMIVIPPEYVVFGVTPNWNGTDVNRDMLIEQLIDGTGLSPDEMVSDFQIHEQRLLGAAVERKTLSEARQFTSHFGFEAAGFTTHPPRGMFPSPPIFRVAEPLKLVVRI
ncbi:hypothetical protein JQU17_22390 [Ponticoccus sp. SC2-23]|uniref:hypothetical protein n=1 Tax=Alexandriicola marinus TaxID=2081710 RepID=UPI000FD738A2|nr:hypothetical protein [Alexandriicola marinus]MBM1222964.1 hypothetical protein [Ponticoccus sp. SC6-9]MBM1227411.1 hypothetical protein [Ponticoccus sp. SC6-15]MBM1231921.1 hypothetical protein [Ponticoccus sp. SC6-38]MBM1236445.1 hypothetical protein [Ponticoccus sp. SC6-45]MBM1240942.1 hypothetical protein [Ponticoccus sp. SC6-49]MBM1245447.1 hypothetical protein [Ponticoccus sp. SC2-64]MBM1249966.1 hypothetical protein [Ponticoccus sp. SC6-42]MBM1254435.1 hypothetical protein [Pontico